MTVHISTIPGVSKNSLLDHIFQLSTPRDVEALLCLAVELRVVVVQQLLAVETLPAKRESNQSRGPVANTPQRP